METENKIHVFWQEHEVGFMLDARPDMYYLEGQWKGNGTSVGEEFERKARKLNLKEVYGDLDKGIPIKLKENAEEPFFSGIVISLTDDSFFLRRMSDH